ncbi:Hsp70 family protein [Dactylosporangium sp. NBC_01737]|uniref:Hsp70 family protein n=1 Tax=Dactylosporangium sp. NBC_01737 TaxID=2975959 RepID=UPI002E159B3E|nr:Hsp70 family protein [Dactylosporangium sp. NBC_01737]
MQNHSGLGVDFGTSTTVAVLAGPDGRPRPLLFDGAELLPSAVCADEDGNLLVGRDAVHAARAYPGGYEPHPKRSVDDGTLLLGGREFPVVDVFAAVLRPVAAEAGRVAGGPVPGAVLTCPAGWGARRQAVLVGAAEAAGLPGPRVLAEPVAATIATGGNADQSVRLWSGDGGRNTVTITGHTAWVRAVAFSPDGATLATGSQDHTIRLWRTSAPAAVRPAGSSPGVGQQPGVEQRSVG